MKKILLLLAAIALSAVSYAQKTAFVNTETIFRAIPEYNRALAEIDEMAQREQTKIDGEYDRIAEMFDRYQSQKMNLSESARRQVEENITSLEKEAAQRQQQIFGADGEIMKKRLELLRPIQERVFRTVDNMAKARGFDLIIDISNNPSIIFHNESLDLSNEVLKTLGIDK